MLAPVPYLDLAGYLRRTKVNGEDVQILEANVPGYIAHKVARGSSVINSRLKKRYAVPLGAEAPTLIAIGTAPPPVTLQGRPVVGSLEMAIDVTTPGALGVAVFQWSSDGGLSWTTGVLTAASVVLGNTGLTALFSASGPYAADNAYSASTPVPEIALGWLVAVIDVDIWQKRGANPQDPAIVMALDERAAAMAELKEAADSDTGLFDLPTNDAAGDDAVTQGGPLFYSETSPFVWMDQQRCIGRGEDRSRSGTTESADTP